MDEDEYIEFVKEHFTFDPKRGAFFNVNVWTGLQWAMTLVVMEDLRRQGLL